MNTMTRGLARSQGRCNWRCTNASELNEIARCYGFGGLTPRENRPETDSDRVAIPSFRRFEWQSGRRPDRAVSDSSQLCGVDRFRSAPVLRRRPAQVGKYWLRIP